MHHQPFMKRSGFLGVCVFVALWFGYWHGHRQGVQEERGAWEETARQHPRQVTLDNETAHVGVAMVYRYRNPHVGPMLKKVNARNVITAPVEVNVE
jgi:hypothetical protein